MAIAGDPLVPLDPADTRLEAPAGATVDADGTVVVVPGEGRYELDRTADLEAHHALPPPVAYLGHLEGLPSRYK